MPHIKPEGSFVALITPFNNDGSVDIEGFGTLLNFHQENGTRAVLIMGSTGEVSMLSTDERKHILEETMKFHKGRMLFYYGCTGQNTEATKDFIQHAGIHGADGAIIAAPAYICASNADIVDFCLEIADASNIPIGFYNNPPRVKTDLTTSDILKLARHENVVVLKESTTRVGQAAELCAAKPDLSLMCCCAPNLGLVISMMSLGGHGTANMSGNIIPQEMAVISTPWKTGEDAFACREAWLHNLELLKYNYSHINPVSVKSLMHAVGLPAGPLRKPLRLLEGVELDRGLAILEDLELDKKYGFQIRRQRLAAE